MVDGRHVVVEADGTERNPTMDKTIISLILILFAFWSRHGMADMACCVLWQQFWHGWLRHACTGMA